MAVSVDQKNAGTRIFGKEGKGILLFKLFFFCHLKCQMPDLITIKNAEALNSLHF